MGVNPSYDDRARKRVKELQDRRRTKEEKKASRPSREGYRLREIDKVMAAKPLSYEAADRIIDQVSKSKPPVKTISNKSVEKEIIKRKADHKKDRAARKKVF